MNSFKFKDKWIYSLTTKKLQTHSFLFFYVLLYTDHRIFINLIPLYSDIFFFVTV